jgi:NADPH-dependent glutamate synthase beta subunit-like oxidoreductase
VKNFGVVELGLSEESAIREAKRCLRCDLEFVSEDTVAEGAKHG